MNHDPSSPAGAGWTPYEVIIYMRFLGESEKTTLQPEVKNDTSFNAGIPGDPGHSVFR